MIPIIDPEFQSLIPPPTAEELAQLEANLLTDGCRDPLVTWHGILIDGHNRLAICTRHGLDFQAVDIDLPDREAAADWIDANQLGRRNLTPMAASELRGRRYNRTKQSRGGQIPGSRVGQNVPSISTAERLATQHGVDERTIKRDGQFAAAVDTLKPVIPDIQQRVMRGDVPSKSAVIEAAREPEKAAEILKPHVSNNSGNNEWYTPPDYIAAARLAMGGIDLDPATSDIANRTVDAIAIFTAEDDGLKQTWHGRVWMNPPYAQPMISEFADAVSDKYDASEIEQACVLVNNATETAWFQRMVASASAVCFPRGRVRFLNPAGAPVGAPLQGQAVIYMGPDPDRFAHAFASFGPVLGALELQEAA